MTILNESGVPDVVSPLWGLAGLAERLPGTLFVVVGTRADVYLAQSLSSFLPGFPADRSYGVFGVHPRVVFVVLEPEEKPPSGALASRVVDAADTRRDVGLVLLIACRSVGLLGVDPGFEAELSERRLALPVRAVAPDTGISGFGVLSTSLEDGVIQALIELCPTGDSEPEEERSYAKGTLFGKLRSQPGRRTSGERGTRRPVVSLGALPGSQEELTAELEWVGVEVAGWLPGTEAGELPPVDEEAFVATADPYLTGAYRIAEERGATTIRTLLPIGVDGTARFIQDVAAWTGHGTGESDRARQVWEELEPLRNRIRGKRIFFTGDTGLEVPLARFLANAGAVILEVGTPRLEKRFLAAELAALGEDVDVVESPEWQAQLNRIDAARPDMVVASPGLYVPLVARGHLCRSSLDLLSLGVHGYEGAHRVLEFFARTFERAEGLDALNL